MSKNYSVTFDVNANISDLRTSLKSINNLLSNASIKIPQNISTNLSKLINTLNLEMDKLESLDGKKLDAKGAKQVNRSYDKIASTFQQIKLTMNDLSKKSGIKVEDFFPSSIEEQIKGATAALKEYKEAIAKGPKKGSEYDKTSQEIKNKKTELQRLKQRQRNEEIKKQQAESQKQALDEQFGIKKQEEDQAKRDKEKAKQDKERARSQKRTLEQQGRLRKKIAALESKEKEETTKAEAKQTEMATKKNKQTAKYAQLQGQYNKYKNAAEEAKKEKEQLEQELQNALKAENDEKEASARETQASAREVAARKESAKLKSRSDTQNNEIIQAQASYESLGQTIQQTESDIANLTDTLEKQKNEFEQNALQTLIDSFKKLGIEVPQAKQNLEDIEKIFNNLSQEAKDKIAQAFKEAGMSLKDLGLGLDKIEDGVDSFNKLNGAAQRSAREMENLQDNILRFFSIGNTIQIFKNAVRSAIDTVKELDAVMTETAVVTDFSVGDMWGKLPEYANKASSMGSSIADLYKATTLYYQQGLQSADAMNVGVETMKMARIANMDAAQATEAMTAALRGFNMEINETSAQRVNDVYSELAAITASDTNQIATAMKKTASIASSANMDFEVTAALLAQIIETTQEAPETAGTAMKTIIARFTEVKELFDEGLLTGEDSEGEAIDINKIDTALKTVGISLKDFLLGSKGIDDIFLELASKWKDLDLATQRYIATTAAGSRQQSRFIAMMSDYDRTMELVSAANNSAGASQKQFGKTLESLDAKIQRLTNAWDVFTMGLANNEAIKGGVDALATLLETINQLTGAAGSKGAGGVTTALMRFLAIAGGLKVGKSALGGFFGAFGKSKNDGGTEETSGIVKKLIPGYADVAKTFGDVSSMGSLLSAVLNGLAGSWQGILNQGNKTKTFWVNTGKELVTFGKNVKNAGSFTKALGVILGSVGGKIALITAAIAGLAIAFKLLSTSPLEEKLKTAKENLENAEQAANNTAESYNELKTSLDSLNDGYDTLETLTYGTREWKTAVQELNNQILELVENFPELAAFVKSNNGVLSLDYDKTIGENKTVDSIVQESLDRTYLANAARDLAKVKTIEAQEAIDYSDIASRYQILYTGEEVLTSAEIQSVKEQIIKDFSRDLANGNVSLNEEGQPPMASWLKQNGISNFELHSVDIGKNYYSELLNYGKQLITTEGEKNLANENAVLNALSKANLTGQVGQAISNIDRDFLTPSLEKFTETAKENYTTLTDLQKGMYATYRGYEFREDGKFYDSSNNVIEVPDEIIQEYLASVDAIDSLSQQIQGYQNTFTQENIDPRFLQEFISGEGQAISKQTLLEFGEYDQETGKFKLKDEDPDAFFSRLGTTAKKMSEIFGISIPDMMEEITNNFESAGDRILDQRKNLVAKMSKYSSQEAAGYENNANILELMERDYGESIVSSLETVFKSLEKTGDNSLITAGYEAFRDVTLKGTKQDAEDIYNFISGIDWSNSIEAAAVLNREIKNGSGASKGFATKIAQIDSSFLDATSQAEAFFKSTDWDEMQEDLTEVLETSDKIVATDILELSKKYKTLNKFLKNTGLSAAAAARMIQKMREGALSVEQLTKAVLAAIGAFDSLGAIAANVLDKLANLDLGIDENQIAGYVKQYSDILNSNLEKGAVGNTQNARILDFMFGSDWDKGMEQDTDALYERMGYLNKVLKKNSKDMRASWADLADNKDVYGEEIEAGSLQGLKIEDKGSRIDLTGYEGMTSSDIVNVLADAYNVSKEYAEMMLADFKNYSLDLAQELNANDFVAGLDEAYQSLETFLGGKTGQKIIDESEIETIANFFGKDFQEALDYFKSMGDVSITDWFDTEGKVQSADNILGQLDKISSKNGGSGKWLDSFISDIDTASEGIQKGFNITDLNKAMDRLNIPKSAQEEIRQGVIDSIKSGAEGAADVITGTLSDGKVHEIPLEGDITLDQGLAKVEKQLQNTDLAAVMSEAMSNTSLTIGNINLPEELSAEGKIQWENVWKAPEDVTAEGTIDYKVGEVEKPVNARAQGTIDYVLGNVDRPPTNGKGKANGNVHVGSARANGSIHVGGTAYANGSNKDGKTLVGEIEKELVVDPHAGRWYTVGNHGAEFVDLPKDAIVFNHLQTEQILKNGNIFSRGKSYASGNAFASGYNTDWGYNNGGGGGEEEWETSLDKLFNLIRQIDEEQRQRTRIERRYEKLLKSIDASAKGIVDISRQELSQLQVEKNVQQDFINQRRKQIAEYEASSGMQGYAWTEWNKYGEQILRINWDLIDAITNEEVGSSVEEYVGKLEEWVDSVNDAEEALYDIEDAIEDIKDRGKDEYFDLEETIKDAIVYQREQEIERLEAINESIDKTNSDILDAIQTSIDRQREDRDNRKTEQELSDKQTQLAYLSQDTSGANDLEIKRLQKEIDEQTEDYTDTLIDQKISKLQEQNEQASEQRQWQIELAQQQLDQYINSGKIWNDVYDLMNDGLDKESGLIRGSKLEEILKNEANFTGLSKIGQLEWWKDFDNMIAQGLGYLELGRQLEDLQGQEGIPKSGERIEFYKDGKFYTGIMDEEGNVKVGEEIFNNVYQGYDGRFYAGENYEIIAPLPEITPEPNQQPDYGNENSVTSGSGKGNKPKKENKNPSDEAWKAFQEAASSEAVDAALAEQKEKIEKTKSDLEKARVKETNLAKREQQRKKQDLILETSEYYKKRGFNTGGLADFTGPAWLDGTKARPEYVLNSVQTQGFLKLVDILDSVKTVSSFNTQSQKSGGDVFDIDINIETVKEEADIDMLTEKIQKSIVSTSKYRNNNFIKR